MIILEVPVSVIMSGLAQGGRVVHPPLAMRAGVRGWLSLGSAPEQQQQQQK